MDDRRPHGPDGLTGTGFSAARDAARPQCAVVLAAGAGTRLRHRPNGNDSPKPLTPVLGVPLILRTLEALREHGVGQAVIVTGYEAVQVRDALTGRWRPEGLALRFVHNERWTLQNGVSVLAAREAVGPREFYLTMGDHLFAPGLLMALDAVPLPAAGLVLAVDPKPDAGIDLDDAVRVQLSAAGRITAIAKRLVHYDAVDAGVFRCTSALFDALADARALNGDCALVDGVARLAAQGRAVGADVGATSWWQDVDTPDDLVVAERKLATAAMQKAALAL